MSAWPDADVFVRSPQQCRGVMSVAKIAMHARTLDAALFRDGLAMAL